MCNQFAICCDLQPGQVLAQYSSDLSLHMSVNVSCSTMGRITMKNVEPCNLFHLTLDVLSLHEMLIDMLCNA